ncbi:MAG: hypothetical protein JNN15_06245 [Blastocatellia bacterium]|nr:hypothetical protein [Blastocatellia bacterium]
MKKLIVYLLFFSTLAFAQNSPPFDLQNVQVTKVVSPNAMGSSYGSVLMGGGTGSANSKSWRVEYRLKNLSDKVITKVGWQIKVLNYNINKQFKTKIKIKPMKETNLSESFDLDEAGANNTLDTQVNITFIEFEDGSIWQYPVPKPEEIR